MLTALLVTLMCLNESTLGMRYEQRLWEPANGMIFRRSESRGRCEFGQGGTRRSVCLTFRPQRCDHDNVGPVLTKAIWPIGVGYLFLIPLNHFLEHSRIYASYSQLFYNILIQYFHKFKFIINFFFPVIITIHHLKFIVKIL